MKGRGLVLILLLLASLPGARGELGAGDFLMEGTLMFPPAAKATFSPSGLVVWDAPSLEAFTFEAEWIRVTEFSAQLGYVGPVAIPSPEPKKKEVHEWTQVNVSVSGARPGAWIGFYFTERAARVESDFPDGNSVHVYPAGDFTSSMPPEPEPQPNGIRYAPTFDVPTLRWNGTGTVVLQGEGSFKMEGIDFRIQSAEGRTDVKTGRAGQKGLYGATPDQWVYVEFKGARIQMVTPKPMGFATPSLDISWVGPASFRPVSGSLRVGDDVYKASGERIRLKGTFQAALWPVQDDEKGLLTGTRLQGELLGTSLASTPLPPNPPDLTQATVPLWPALLFLALVAGGGLLMARHRHDHAFSVEECLSMASRAAEEGRFEVALAWTRRALRQAPRSARMHADAGFFLSSTGDVPGALAAYEQASRLSEDGEADFLAARLVIVSGGDVDDAVPYLNRALHRTPSLALELESDEVLKGLQADPIVRQFLQRALRRL